MHLARKVEDRELPLLLAARSTVGSTEGLQVLQGGVKKRQALQVSTLIRGLACFLHLTRL